MPKQKDEAPNLVPYPIIAAAAHGDAEAINTVLKHYERYISTLATKKLFYEYGNSYFCVDDELRRRLETKLITKILTFNVD